MQITPETLSQYLPFYLTQSAKEGLAKALAEFPHNFPYYLARYADTILQGDGWNELEVINFDTMDRKAIKGIIISNSCDIDPANPRDLPSKISFAPIIKLSTYVSLLAQEIDAARIANKIEAIKKQEVTNIFYLPSVVANEDYIALLNEVHTIPFSSFQQRPDRQKIFTLSGNGFYLFLLKLSVHFCRFHEELDREAA